MKNNFQLLAALLLALALAACDGSSSEAPTDPIFPVTPVAQPEPKQPHRPDQQPGMTVEAEPVLGPNSKYCINPELDDSAAIAASLNKANGGVPANFPSLLPLPAYGDTSGNSASFDSRTLIAANVDDANVKAVVDYLKGTLNASTGYGVPVNPMVIGEPSVASPPCIKLELKELKGPNGERFGPEAYSLITGKKGVAIRAATAQGLFNGVQTFLQLLPPAIYGSQTPSHNDLLHHTWDIPAVKIVDWPRFAYRGTMLDVARRFYSVGEVKRYIDEIALLKINTLHLHLADDQGWRIAIDELPELTTIGGTTQSGFASKPDNQWFYTRKQYADIVAYAASRFITIVPEIDGPGHTLAAQASVANLNCNNTRRPPYAGFDVGNPTICLDDAAHVGSAKAYLNTVLTSVAALTPGPYLHIGGDEAPGMTPEKMSAYVDGASVPAAKAKKLLMGWHQIAQGTLPAGTVLQYWGDESYRSTIGTAAENENIAYMRIGLSKGAKFVMSPADHAYLDMKYDDTTPYGLKWEGTVSIQKSYDWDPTTKLTSVDGKTRLLADNDILGVEAPLWADRAFTDSLGSLPIGPNERFVPPTTYTDYMAFPRLASAAEIGWSPFASHSWDSFKTRLGYQGARWDAFGIGFYRSKEIDWKTPSDPFVVNQ